MYTKEWRGNLSRIIIAISCGGVLRVGMVLVLLVAGGAGCEPGKKGSHIGNAAGGGIPRREYRQGTNNFGLSAATKARQNLLRQSPLLKKNPVATKPHWEKKTTVDGQGRSTENLRYSGVMDELPRGSSRDVMSMVQGVFRKRNQSSEQSSPTTSSPAEEATSDDIRAMVPAKHYGNFFKRRETLRQIQASPDPRHLPAVKAILLDPQDPLSGIAAPVLGKIGGSEAAAALVQAMQDERFSVRVAALGALVDMRAKQAAAVCLDAIQHDPHHSVRAAAAIGLGTLQEKSAVPALRQVLLKDKRSVQFAAAWGLGLLHDPEGIAALTRYARMADAAISPVALRALASTKFAPAIPVIYGALYARKGGVQNTALALIAALPEARRRRGMRDLVRTDRERFELRFHLLQSLKGREPLPEKAYAQVYQGGLADRTLALRGLVRRGAIKAVPVVIGFLRHQEKTLALIANAGLRPLCERLDLPGQPRGLATQEDWQVWWFRLHKLLAIKPGAAILRLPDGRRREVTRDSLLDWRTQVEVIHPGRGSRGTSSGYVLIQVGARPIKITADLNY